MTSGHRLSPHTADCVIEAWGPDRAACMAEALVALVEEFACVHEAPTVEVLPVSVEPGPPDDQLVSLLEEVIYTLDVFALLPVRAHLGETEDGGIAGDMEVVPVEHATLIGPVPKAVSYHELSVVKEERGWRCRALIDV